MNIRTFPRCGPPTALATPRGHLMAHSVVALALPSWDMALTSKLVALLVVNVMIVQQEPLHDFQLCGVRVAQLQACSKLEHTVLSKRHLFCTTEI